MTFCALNPVLPAFADEVSDAENELTEAQNKLSESQAQINELKETISNLQDSLDEYEDDVEGVSAQIENISAQIENKNAEIELIQGQIEVLEQDKKEQYELMKTRVKYTYENGTASYLQLLLEAKTLSELLNRAEYIVSVREYDENILDEYTQTCQALSERKSEMDAQLTELSALKEESEVKQDELATLISNTGEAIASSNEELEDEMARQQAIEEDIEAKTLAAAQAQAEALAKAAAEKAKAQAEAEAKAAEEAADESDSSDDSSDSSDSSDDSSSDDTSASSYTAAEGDLAIMSAIIYCEAGGESYEGQLAVGSVVMNRVNSSDFPNTVEGVIRQSGQFSPVTSGRFDTVLSNQSWTTSCQNAAQEVLNGNITVSYLYFHSASGWTSSYGEHIGNQVFY